MFKLYMWLRSSYFLLNVSDPYVSKKTVARVCAWMPLNFPTSATMQLHMASPSLGTSPHGMYQTIHYLVTPLSVSFVSPSEGCISSLLYKALFNDCIVLFSKHASFLQSTALCILFALNQIYFSLQMNLMRPLVSCLGSAWVSCI